jgi:hypothetical protein
MSNQLQLHDLVALLEDVPTLHVETRKPLLLRRGQMGTVVMLFGGKAARSSSPIEMGGRMRCSPSRSTS